MIESLENILLYITAMVMIVVDFGTTSFKKKIFACIINVMRS